MSKNTNVEVVEMENETMEVVTPETKSFMTKVKDGFKKHGKKVATGVALGVVGLIGFALGRSTGGGDYEIVEDIDINFLGEGSSDTTDEA